MAQRRKSEILGLVPEAASGTNVRSALAAVLSSVFIVGMAIGFLVPLMSLMLRASGYGPITMGLAAGCFAGASLVFGPLVPALASRVGPAVTLAAGASVAALGVIAVPFVGRLEAWIVLWFIIGSGTTLLWILSEAWVNHLADARNRGRILGIYTMLWAGGAGAGVFLLAFAWSDGPRPFLVGALMLIAAAVLPMLVRQTAPRLPERSSEFGIAALMDDARRTPGVMKLGLIVGWAEGSCYVLLPVFLLEQGSATVSAVSLISAFAIGKAVAQPVVGWVSDRITSQRLLPALATLALVCLMGLATAMDNRWLIAVLLFLLGGATVGHYTLALVELGRLTVAEKLVSANTAFVIAYNLGLIVGPVASGLALEVWQPHGLVLVLSGAFLVGLMPIGPNCNMREKSN